MWKYRVGFSIDEARKILGSNIQETDIEKLLNAHHFEFSYEAGREVFNRLINEVLGATYKNPSTMQKDAPNAFSCSSLVSYFSTMAGMPWMPSITVDKYVYLKPIKQDELKFGDLVFSNSEEGKIYYESIEWRKGTKVPEGVDHVGIYLEDGKVLHSSRYNEKGTEIQNLNESLSFKNKIVGYRRIADIDEKRYCVIVPNDKPELFNAKSLLRYLVHAPKDDYVAHKNEIPYISQLINIPDLYWANRACGGVCLLMALSYFGIKVENYVDFLNEAEKEGYFTQNYGWYHQGLIDLAKKYELDGYRTEGGTVDDIAEEIKKGNVPILSVQKRLFGTKRNHLVVATGYSKDPSGKIAGVYIHDPERLYNQEDPQYVDVRHLDLDWNRRYIVIKKDA